MRDRPMQFRMSTRQMSDTYDQPAPASTHSNRRNPKPSASTSSPRLAAPAREAATATPRRRSPSKRNMSETPARSRNSRDGKPPRWREVHHSQPFREAAAVQES